MAEDSAFWAGTVLGDAASSDVWQAPYSDIEYSDVWSKLLASNDNQGFVIPDYENKLEVVASSPTAMTVAVKSGGIFIRGRVYENTSQLALTITTNSSGSPRLDRVIARITFSSQIIRLAVLTGTPASPPSLPALTQTAVTYEVSLGYVWVADGATSIANTDIHDEREFACVSANFNDSYNSPNLIHNSEFMGFSQLSGGATTNPPDGWDLVLTPSDIASSTKPPQMSRGRAIQITTDAASEGISQTVFVKASTTYAIKLLTRVTAGDVGSISVTTNSAAPGTITRYTRRTGAWLEEKIIYTTEADATSMAISLLGLNSGDVIQYGQTILAEGYIPGPFRQIQEQIMFTESVTDSNWNADGKLTGTTNIDLDADYQTLLLSGTKAVYLSLQASGSNSALQVTQFDARPYGSSVFWVGMELTNLNSTISRYTSGWVPVDSSLRFSYVVVGGGGSTVTCTASIIGILV